MSNTATVYFDRIETVIGNMVLAASDKGLFRVSFQDVEDILPESWRYSPEKLVDASRQLVEYFEGKRRQFDLQLAAEGTAFHRQVWQALTEIPYGETITYGQLAEKVQSPKGYRAVGNANGKNPLVIIQPCHRVVASGGKLGGFSAGLFRKKFLLKLEKGANSIF